MKNKNKLFYTIIKKQKQIKNFKKLSVLKPNSIRRKTTEPYKTLFPIPERVLANNPNFIQNVGY